MICYDPCGRLKVIYHQLVPSILNSAKNKTATNIRSAIEDYLPKLEDQSFVLARQCGDCNKCNLCEEESIQELFQTTRDSLVAIWDEKNNIICPPEESPHYNPIDLLPPAFQVEIGL